MNIIEEIESLKVRIDKEAAEYQRQLDLLSAAAAKIGHRIGTVRSVAGEYKVVKELDIPQQYPLFPQAQAPAKPVEVAKQETSTVPQKDTKKPAKATKRSYTIGATKKALRAIATGQCAVRAIAMSVYGDISRRSIQKTYGLLYDIVQRGQANKVIVRKKTEQVSAWSLTPLGRSLLENTGS